MSIEEMSPEEAAARIKPFNTLTPYERATLKLNAWKAIEGWGTGAAGTFNWTERQERADMLLAWMLS